MFDNMKYFSLYKVKFEKKVSLQVIRLNYLLESLVLKKKIILIQVSIDRFLGNISLYITNYLNFDLPKGGRKSWQINEKLFHYYVLCTFLFLTWI